MKWEKGTFKPIGADQYQSSGGKHRIQTSKDENGDYRVRLTGTNQDSIVVAKAGEPQPTEAQVIIAIKKAFGAKLKVRTHVIDCDHM